MKNTTLCYIEKDGCYLLLHRVKKKNDLNHNKWVGIGGKFEETESPEECLLRETREETGLTIEHPRLCGVKDWEGDDGSRYLVALYRADRFSGTLCASDEGRVFWVERSEFAQMNIIWNMKDVLCICDGEGFSELYWDDARPGWVLLG